MFPDGGRVLLDPRGAPEGARFEVRWFDADYLAWQQPYEIEASNIGMFFDEVRNSLIRSTVFIICLKKLLKVLLLEF